MRPTPTLLAFLAAITTANAAPLTARADESSQCPCPDYFLNWTKSYPSMNAGLDFGAPYVEQGKVSAKDGSIAGQPKKGKGTGVRNFILTIPDGFGPASQTMARTYHQWKVANTSDDQGWNAQLPADELLIGSARTRPSSGLITDSAASASAYSCGIKTFNGGISVDEDGYPCGTVLEAAHALGFKTGLVATSTITHATPAAFASHIYDRNDEAAIAEQLIGKGPNGRVVDVMLGGGISFFAPNSSKEWESGREDDKDVFQMARDAGFHVFTDRAGFDALEGGKKAQLPYLGVFTESNMNYDLDRDASKEPSISEMTKTALNSLKEATKDSEKGFFIMIEGSRIDHSGHASDAVGHLHEVLAWNEAVKAMREFVDEDGESVMIGVADHETGAISLGGMAGDNMEWKPEVLDAGKHTSTFLAEKWAEFEGDGKKADNFLRKEIFEAYGIMEPNATEIQEAKNLKDEASTFAVYLGKAVGWRALVNFGSTVHSPIDVNIIGHPTEKVMDLVGNHDNTEVALFIVNQLGLDLPQITEFMNSEENADWVKNVVGVDKVEKGTVIEEATELRRRSLHHHHH